MLKISFLGNSFASSICDYWKLCDGKDASVELEIDTAGQVTVGHTLAVAASGRGQARVMIKRGTLYVDSYGIRLATGSQATGEMRVDGGVLDLASTANSNPAACGFVIGDGSSGNMSEGIHNGVVAISGGIVTNRNRTAMIVGIGRAKGLVRMSGGNVFHRSERVIVLGMQGAEGAWEMSGGTVNSLRDLYIGGCDKSLIAWAPTSAAMKNWVCPTGRMSISGGTFETSRDVIVSAEGKGELELSGTGVLSAANLILSNKVDSATTHVADLKFTTGADVCGSIRLSGRLAIGAGARLTVDASAFTGDRIQLVKADSVEGAFDGGNISLVCPRSDVQLVTRRDGIVLKAKKGMILLVR